MRFGFAIVAALVLVSADSPVCRTFAYSRATTPGIPAGRGVAADPGRAVSTTYFVYVAVPKGTRPSVRGAWLKGVYYAATLRKVPSPVTVEHDAAVPTGKKDVLVPATRSDVYQVSPAEEKAWTPASDAERRLTQDNEVVVFLEVNRATVYCPVKVITALAPTPGK